MAADKTSTMKTKIEIDGEKAYKDAVLGINTSLKTLNSEMRLVSATYADNAKSSEALKSKQDVLKKTLEEQKNKVKEAEKALKDLKSQGFDETNPTVQKFQQNLNNAKAEVAKTENEIKNIDKELKSNKINWEAVGSAVKTAGAVIGGACVAAAGAVAGVATGMFKMAESAAAVGGEVNIMSQKLGMSRQGYQEWEYVLKKSGTSIDVMNTGMKTLQKTMGGLTEDGDKSAEAFKDIGISFDEIQGKSPEEALNMTVKALQDMPPGADRTTAALKLFGKGAMDLMPLLNKTSEETDELKDRAHNLGLIMGDEQINASGKFRGAMGKIKDTISGMKMQISNALIPSFADGLSAFLDFANGAEGGEEKMKSAVDGMVTAITTTIPQIVQKGADMIQALITGLSMALPGIAAAIGEALPGIIGVISELLPQLVSAVVEAVPVIVNALIAALPLLVNAAVEIVIALVDGISAMIPTLIPVAIEAIVSIVDGLLSNLSPLIGAALQIIITLAQGLLQAIPEIIKALPPIITSLISTLLESIPLIIQAGIDLLTALVDALPEIITAIVEALPLIITGIIDALMENIPLIIQAGIDLLISLIQALPQIITTLVQAIPQIISGLVTAILGNIPQIIQAGISLLVSLIQNLPTIIIEIVKAVPQIISGLVSGFTESFGKIKEVGTNLIKGLWDGIMNAKDWIMGKIKGFMDSILGGIKSFFGISSPSKVFEKEIGANLAAGISVGFEKQMDKVANDMNDSLRAAMPNLSADFDILAGVDSATSVSSKSSPLLSALAELTKALKGLRAGDTNYNINIPPGSEEERLLIRVAELLRRKVRMA